MRSNKLWFYLSLVACLAIGILVRVLYWPTLTADVFGHLNFLDPDNYYQLRRLVYTVENFPQVLYFDPLADWPVGSPVDWPEALPLLSASLIKILGVFGFESSSFLIEGIAALLMVFFWLLSSFLLFAISQMMGLSRVAQVFILFAFALNAVIVRHSFVGTYDHHITECFYICLAIYIGLKLNHNAGLSRGCDRLRFFGWGLLLITSLAFSSSGLLTVGALFGALAVRAGGKQSLQRFFYLFLGMLIFLIPYASYQILRLDHLFDIRFASGLHLFVVISFGLITGLCIRYQHQKIMILSFCSFVLVVLMGFDLGGLRASFFSALGYMQGEGGVLQNVLEATPIFLHFGELHFTYMHWNLSFLLYSIVLLPLLLRRAQASRSLQFFVLAFFIFSLMPGVAQKRFIHFMIPAFILYLGIVLDWILSGMSRYQLRLQPLVILAFFSLILLPNIQYGFYPTVVAQHQVDWALAKSLRQEAVADESPQNRIDRLALRAPAEYGFWVNPNLGHQISYLTGRGTVLNSYYHTSTFLREMQLRRAQEPQEFASLLRDNQIGYFMVADDFFYYDKINSLTRLHDFAIVEATGANAKTVRLDLIEDEVWFRLLMGSLDVDEIDQLDQLEQLGFYQFDVNHFYTQVRLFKTNVLGSSSN